MGLEVETRTWDAGGKGRVCSESKGSGFMMERRDVNRMVGEKGD